MSCWAAAAAAASGAAAGAFVCDEADFVVRSVPDDVHYGVKRTCLTRSEVFRDMFACCELGYVDVADENGDGDDDDGRVMDQVLDMHESAAVLDLLLRLLHYPPVPPTPRRQAGEAPGKDSRYDDDDDDEDACYEDTARDWFRTRLRVARYDTGTLIPLPLLPALLGVADKYALGADVVDALRAHVRAHAPGEALRVYGLAAARAAVAGEAGAVAGAGVGVGGCAEAAAWADVAAEASMYLLAPPVHRYTPAQAAQIPTVGAYHRLVQLQAHRVERLRGLLLAEELFPHRYGACPYHAERAADLWGATQRALAPRVEAATDVAAEMASVAKGLQNCRTCLKACTAAVEMLAYKCRRVPIRVDALPDLSVSTQ